LEGRVLLELEREQRRDGSRRTRRRRRDGERGEEIVPPSERKMLGRITNIKKDLKVNTPLQPSQ